MLYLKWSDLLDVLDIAFQIYLYMIGGKELTIDVRCAFLIELAEAFVEIVKRYKGLFPELQPGDKKTTLRECLKSLIDEYGSTVFKKGILGKI